MLCERYVEPVSGRSNSFTELSDAVVPLPVSLTSWGDDRTTFGQHVLAVRLYDQADNVSSLKLVGR